MGRRNQPWILLWRMQPPKRVQSLGLLNLMSLPDGMDFLSKHVSVGNIAHTDGGQFGSVAG
jgi:hypothetical protein